jgi:hypothetical protein
VLRELRELTGRRLLSNSARVVLYSVVRDWQRDREVGGACEVEEVEVET